jgi:hypothetical protein
MNGLSILGITADVCGVLAAGFSGYVACVTWLRRRAAARSVVPVKGYPESFKHYKDTNPPDACILSVVLLPHTTDVDHDITEFYLRQSRSAPNLRVSIRMAGINNLPEDLETFLNEMRRARAEVDALDASEVHLFFAGPVGAALLAGAVLDHWKLVKLHQQNLQTRAYDFWGTLQK